MNRLFLFTVKLIIRFIYSEINNPCDHLFLSITFFTLSKTVLTLSFLLFSLIYLKFGVLLPNSKNIHYTLYLTSNMRMCVA